MQIDYVFKFPNHVGAEKRKLYKPKILTTRLSRLCGVGARMEENGFGEGCRIGSRWRFLRNNFYRKTYLPGPGSRFLIIEKC